MKVRFQYLISVFAPILMASCGDSGEPNPTINCSESNLILSVSSQTNTPCATSDASVTVAASGGDGNYTFSVDGGVFGSSNIFGSLDPGIHEVTVKDGNGCEDSESVTILSGISFSANITGIISSNCAISGCHVAGTGRQNFEEFSVIQTNAFGIKTRTQSGNMPPGGGLLTQSEIDFIACWVDDGAQDN